MPHQISVKRESSLKSKIQVETKTTMTAEADDNTPDQPLVVQDEHQTQPQGKDTNMNPINGASDASNTEKKVLENASLSGDENNTNGGTNNNREEEDDDNDSALARMMAIQEEEQLEEESFAVEQNEHDIIDYDPNIAYLGNNDDDFPEDDILAAADNNNIDAAPAANNNNNPAAIALRQRQALQNQRRLDQMNALNNQPFLTRQLLKLIRPSNPPNYLILYLGMP